MDIDLKDVLTVEEAAAKLGCSVLTVRRRISNGFLTPIYLFGRQLLKAVEVDALPPPRRGVKLLKVCQSTTNDDQR